ncbi:MAG: 50S ribosomal protein L25 [Bacteroidales bacterium]|nr:50S ribosomal protein L25 [Bacteroidales bacterium]
MKEITLNAQVRKDLGKKASRDLRRAGMVPCNIYGVKKDEKGLPVAQSLVVSDKELAKLLYTPNVYIINLNIEGKTVKAILKELQNDFVKDTPVHVDFYEITDAPIVMEIPVKLNGLAEGVRAGGKLSLNVRKLKVKAPYTQMPDTLDIDVTNMALGKTMKVAELSFEGLEIVTSKEVVVCAVRVTRASRSAATEEGAGAAEESAAE